ncbi:protein mushroom body miniature [Drosophila grimshawi]|uniref:GH10222 n=1 Tax=Drosophila grimshawi TaxID=7222 RepID=B4JBF9_DROGR|nr:protein mushroom body miniature [Drosophila grimshawi]EDW03982.1 GH10222 [Drosophila grimshawi]
MQGGRERRPSGNWQNNSGANDYHFGNNNSNQANGNWAGKRHNPSDNFNRNAGRGGCGGGVGGGDESFEKFRDPNQLQSYPNRQQLSQRRFQDNNHRDNRKHEQRGNKGRRNDKFGRNGKGSSNDKGGRRGVGRGGRNNGAGAAGPWYNDGAMPNDLFYFDNGQLGKEQSATGSVEQTIAPPVAGEPPTEAAPAIVMPVVEATAVVEKPAAAATQPPTFINAANIKKEKKDPSPKTKPAKPAESSADSSSSSSDESVEAGEVVRKREAAIVHKAKVKSEIAAKPPAPSSSSSEEESDDDTPSPVKVQTVAKESTPKSAKTLKKHASEEDVVCLGKERRKFTIPDEDERDVDDEEDPSSGVEEQKSVKSKEKANHPCGICDKKGHTSFECQMICRNCSASYHSLKNCPNPPNLSIALQAFMEFTMQQLTVFNVDKRFAFPAGVVSTTPAISQPTPPAVKSKKDKQRTLIKKSKKTPKKKLKIEKHDSDDDDEEDDDDDDDEADADAISESDSESESSSDPKPALSKTKRKRSSTKQAPNMPPAAAFPFPLLAAGSHYNPMMYPYAAPFNFPK